MRSSSYRIAHVVPAMFGDDGVLGGAERYAFELAKAMAEYADVTLLAFGNSARSENHGSLKISVIKNDRLIRGQPNNPFSSKLFSVLSDFDVVHFHQKYILVYQQLRMWHPHQ